MRFNKKTLAIATVVLLVAGTGSAALLTSFGTVTGDATVSQSVVIDDKTASSESGPTIDANFENVVAGDLTATEHTVENNLDEPVMVSMATSGNEAGVDVAHLLYVQNDNDGDDSYDVSAEAVDPIADGSNYAVHLEGESTVDYGTLYYAVSGLNSDDKLKFDFEEKEGHKAGTNGIDEVYLYDSEGNQYAITGANADSTEGTVTVDLSNADWHDEEPTDYSDIVAVGIGYGDASAAFQGQTGSSTTVNVTVDNVRVNQNNIDEASNRDTYLMPTGEMNTDLLDTTTRYSVQTVASFDVATVPGDYTVETEFGTGQ